MQERKGRPCDLAQEEEAMEEGNCKAAQGLSWRSRNTSWWTSAVDLSSTLLSKMDQVPLMGFALPWHAGARGDQSKALQSPQEFGEKQPLELPKRRNEIVKPVPALESKPLEIAKPALDCEPAEVVDSCKGQTEQEDSNPPIEDIAAEETRLTPRGVRSRRRTKRMAVDLAPAGSNQDDDGNAPIRSKKLSAVGQEILLGESPGTSRAYAEEMRRLCIHRKQLSEAAVRRVDNASVLSSRRSCHSSQSWSRLEETIKNNPPHALPAPPTESYGIIATRTEESLLLGDSNRELKPVRLREGAVVLGGSARMTREALDVRKAPSASLPASPRFSKESRASKLFQTLGISTTRAGNEIVVSKKLSKQPGLQAVNNLIVSQHRKFAKSLEPRKLGITNGAQNHEDGALVEHSRKKSSSSRWLFKWIWGSSKPAAPKLAMAPPQLGEAPPLEPKPTRHKRTSSWGCASHASTAVITPLRRSRIHQDDNDATENIVESRVDCHVPEAYQDCQGSFENPESFRGQESFRKSEVFESCHGSFRSVTSCASFRSTDSRDETDWGLPPPLQADQSLTIGDVAALCNSSFKFVFKCREIQHFNMFLRSQKKRLLSAEANTDCFNVILSGSENEVSSMVAALAYAWFLHNSATGKTWHAVAVIDIPRHQMHKRKDAAWLFDACGIDPTALLFADEMELASLVGAGRIKISTIGQDILVTRNEVGSVCTLLGEKLVAEAERLLEPRYMKTLLLAGVLLDTENLDFASMRDTEITTSLLVGSGSLGRNGFFEQLRDVEDDDQVCKLITRSYGDAKKLSRRKTSSGAHAKMQQEADQEQSDKDSLFTHSQDQTSTSEAGTSSSSVDEDSPRLKQRFSFKHTKLPSRSAPARSQQLQSPSSSGCKEDEKAVAHIRKAAATQFVSSSGGTRSSNFPRIRKKLILYQV